MFIEGHLWQNKPSRDINESPVLKLIPKLLGDSSLVWPNLKSDFHLLKINSVICFIESRLQMMKNVFCFILKALFVLNIFKAALSSSKKNFFICFNDVPSKMMKKVFYFIWKALFVLEIFKYLFWLFGHLEKTACLDRSVNFEIHDVTDWLTMNYNTKFGQLIEHPKRNIFL